MKNVTYVLVAKRKVAVSTLLRSEVLFPSCDLPMLRTSSHQLSTLSDFTPISLGILTPRSRVASQSKHQIPACNLQDRFPRQSSTNIHLSIQLMSLSKPHQVRTHTRCPWSSNTNTACYRRWTTFERSRNGVPVRHELETGYVKFVLLRMCTIRVDVCGCYYEKLAMFSDACVESWSWSQEELFFACHSSLASSLAVIGKCLGGCLSAGSGRE